MLTLLKLLKFQSAVLILLKFCGKRSLNLVLIFSIFVLPLVGKRRNNSYSFFLSSRPDVLTAVNENLIREILAPCFKNSQKRIFFN